MYADMNWYRSQQREDETIRSAGFLITSSILHVAFFAFLWTMGSWFVTEAPQIIEFTINGDSSAAMAAMAAAPEVATAPAPSEMPAATSKEDVVVPRAAAVPVPAKALTPITSKSTAHVARAASKASAAPVAVHQAPRELVAPDLDDSDVQQEIAENLQPTAVSTKAVQQDLDKNLDDVDDTIQAEHQKNVQALKRNLYAQSQAVQQHTDAATRELQEQTQEEDQALAAHNAMMQQSNAEQVQQAQAAESQAHAQQVAAQRAHDQQVAAARAAANREAAARAQAAAVQDIQNKNAQAEKAMADRNRIRDVSELRQMPGNPQPQYDQVEQMNGHQGRVSFQAWVTKSGELTQFRILQSSGFRNLDAKTFGAIKKWKFYPGQEGWVEIPFQWDLKGGVQEVPARLRTVSQQ